jgi:N-acetylglucosaminylphosphatidylinositol deacetylase
MDKKKIIILVVIIIVFLIIIFVVLRKKHKKKSKPEKDDKTNIPIPGENFLLVIAHPDDEAMFFIPTLYNLKQQQKKIYVYCASNGDYYHEGKTRTKEMEKSCKTLGVEKFFIDKFQDHPKKEWDISQLTKNIDHLIKSWKIDCIITFDETGISGHLNHISCNEAVKLIDIQKYQLLKNHASKDTFSYHFHLSDSSKAQLHMKHHKSQYTWYRKLWVKYSSYACNNYLTEIVQDPETNPKK